MQRRTAGCKAVVIAIAYSKSLTFFCRRATPDGSMAGDAGSNKTKKHARLQRELRRPGRSSRLKNKATGD
jgi:hypothetical protein